MDDPLDRPTTPSAKEPRFEEQVRRACRFRQFSIRTEEAYWGWAKQFILHHGKRHPRDMGEVEIRDFLTHLAADRNVAASTQNQALNALVFIYKNVLGRPAGDLTGIERASRPAKIPVVLSEREVRALLAELEGTMRCMALLLYGAGLRLPLRRACILRSAGCRRRLRATHSGMRAAADQRRRFPPAHPDAAGNQRREWQGNDAAGCGPRGFARADESGPRVLRCGSCNGCARGASAECTGG